MEFFLLPDTPPERPPAQDIDTNTLISNPRSEKFQKAKHGLGQFIENYESRIFIFHIQKIIGYKSQSYQMISF